MSYSLAMVHYINGTIIITMIRQNLKPVIFVINNDGYTVERMIHGMKEPYNDIRMWDYKALPAVFGGDNVEVHDVNTSEELKRAFEKLIQIAIVCTM